MPAGRPTSFKQEYIEQAAKLCALGATDVQMADFFGVCEKTLNTWKHEHPKFLQSIKQAKDDADNNVEKSLYQTALGGNTTAQIFWLKNRRPNAWRDQKHHDHTTDGKSINQKSTAELEKMVADAE